MEKEPPSGETREEVETKTQEKEKVPEMPWEREIRLERKRLLEEHKIIRGLVKRRASALSRVYILCFAELKKFSGGLS